MKNQQFLKLLKSKKKNSGFTLLELLTGLIMSIFVTGALGFGLYQILTTTGRESSKISARNEVSRALEFISDEIRRARTIDNDLLDDLDGGGVDDDNTAPNFTTTDKTVVLALDIPDITDHVDIDPTANVDYIGSDDDNTTSERVIYYLKSTNIGNWQGPQVLYRWGPPLDANGNYTGGAWQDEALIDGIDDEVIDNACSSGTQSPATAKGFYACISGDKTAQLFLTGGIYANKGEANSNTPSETYTADTKVVARAKNVTVNQAQADPVTPTSFQTLLVDYNCSFNKKPLLDADGNDVVDADGNPIYTIDQTSTKKWDVKLDFNNNDLVANPTKIDDTTSWVHKDNRQPQPFEISTENDLKINLSPVGKTGCTSSGNPNTTGKEPLSSYSYTKEHTIKFMKDPLDDDGNPNPKYNPNDWKSFNGNDANDYDNPDVKGDGSVLVLKNGSKLTGELNLSGYNYNSEVDDSSVQQSLGEFLKSRGYAVYDSSLDDGKGGYIIDGLDSSQRILAFELGHSEKYLNNDPDQPNAGFDVNDAIFIMNNDQFAEEWSN